MIMHGELVLSQADGRPMYLQILEQVKAKVALGDWPPGHPLPSIRRLAIDLRVSVITVKRAYLELEREGIIVTRQGKGSQVAADPGLAPRLGDEELDQHLEQLVRTALRQGLDLETLTSRLRDKFSKVSKPDLSKPDPSKPDLSKEAP